MISFDSLINVELRCPFNEKEIFSIFFFRISTGLDEGRRKD
jgi:hypothetical protein